MCIHRIGISACKDVNYVFMTMETSECKLDAQLKESKKVKMEKLHNLIPSMRRAPPAFERFKTLKRK